VNERWHRRGGLEWVDVDDEIVVHDLAGGQLHRLNATAATVWRACDGRPFTAIVESVQRVYAGEAAVIARDVRTVVEAFLAAALVEAAEG
jgi:sugar lactone lactonase YvrE